MTMANSPTTPRERYRDEVTAEIKRLAEAQLAEVGPGGLSLTGIARELGMTGPALYRYFASRDALLTELVIDAYNDLAAALRAAVSSAVDAQLAEFLHAYRAWALAHPHRYRLLYQPPLPNFDANADAVVAAATGAMTILIAAVTAHQGTRSRHVSPARAPRNLAQGFTAWADATGVDASPDVVLDAVLLWSRLHGFVSLEIARNLALMAPDADALFAVEVESLVN
jgi:AcrR family transcriptional regulator